MLCLPARRQVAQYPSATTHSEGHVIYRFHSKAGADVVMLPQHGQSVLEAMGKQADGQGILLNERLPGLISTLEATISGEEQHWLELEAQAQARGEPVPQRPEVMLRQRAWPLLQLMRAAQSSGADIVWGV
ncbi:DUF1840 domain-containing protein [Roseateles sp. BYS180W]|uniref:DUF1840 domain-containing protein n=1 Tax=Roseateles rivi TaxID=3299028 RepID=A0ABW7FUQ0_9BURK